MNLKRKFKLVENHISNWKTQYFHSIISYYTFLYNSAHFPTALENSPHTYHTTACDLEKSYDCFQTLHAVRARA